MSNTKLFFLALAIIAAVFWYRSIHAEIDKENKLIQDGQALLHR